MVSAGTILFNKHALSSYGFPAPNALLTFQFGLAVVLLKLLHVLGLLHLEPLRWDIAKRWFSLNLIFVFMNATGFYALMLVSAGMFTVLKNLSNLLTIVGDWYFFGRTYSWQVWACLGLMIVSAGMGGWSDLSFSLEGYLWQLVNCVFTAAYSLHLSAVVRSMSSGAALGVAGQPTAGSTAAGSQHAHAHGQKGHPPPPRDRDHHGHAPAGSSGGHAAAGGAAAAAAGRRRISELSMVYYNNVLSVPPFLLLSVLFGEPVKLVGYPHFRDPSFVTVVLVGALMGFAVSFASIWCMSRTSATIYSLTGSMNKVVVALVGMWYFMEPVNTPNLLSILLGLLAGFLFVFAKAGSGAMMVGGGGPGGGQGPAGKEREKERDVEAAERRGSGDGGGSVDGGGPVVVALGPQELTSRGHGGGGGGSGSGGITAGRKVAE